MPDGGLREHRIETRQIAPPIHSQQLEADHRIANSLQFLLATLRHQSRRLGDVEDARSALETASLRLMGTARLHRHLSLHDPDGEVDLLEFLAPIAASIEESVGARVVLGGKKVRVGAHMASP